jgi:hypothetical protein
MRWSLAERSRRECLVFKVDFEKAYDSVSLSFLLIICYVEWVLEINGGHG